jgi:site-specific recombinase XerD
MVSCLCPYQQSDSMSRKRGLRSRKRCRGRPFRSVRSAFRTACKNAGLKGVTPHTLRHTFASRLVMAGVDLRTVQELGGWASLRMVERYSHLSPSHRAEAIERIASKNFTNAFHNTG